MLTAASISSAATRPSAEVFPEKLFEFRQPVRVLFGRGQIAKLGQVTAEHGKRVFVVTMADLVEIGLVDRALAPLRAAGLDLVVYSQTEREPTCTHVDEVAAQVRDAKTDVLVAIGGGSAMDVAKAAAIRATHPEPTWLYVNLSNRPPLPIQPVVLPIIAVPTTSGTGAEVTPYAVMSNNESVQKGTIKDPQIFPRVAIVDPELIVGLPASLTGATGVDAFAHAMESYFNKANRTPYSDMVAREAMLALYDALPNVVRAPRDLDLRTRVAWGSMLAGVAIANGGTTVAHALAQPLGARAHVSHAESVAIFTVPVLRHTWDADVDRFAALAHLLDPQATRLSSEQAAQRAVELVAQFLEAAGMTKRIRDFHPPAGLEDGLVADVFGYMRRPLGQHPKMFAEPEIRQIIAEAW